MWCVWCGVRERERERVCVCVCVCERERVCVCVCVCVCVVGRSSVACLRVLKCVMHSERRCVGPVVL